MAYTTTPKNSEAQRRVWREHSAQWQSENREQHAALCRSWYQRNKDKVAEARRLKREAAKAKANAERVAEALGAVDVSQ
ncbi:hypothetical protein BQ8794_280051 [Mesorhizobium prunaredense]|uniref:Uncharacterized protein n=1 Tax=Mesorhizobium prunaredense TaxID=1631249 RepID=A0A1R3V8T7_9HYPH|nr:hypothetical protein BQ8794_280051 [Mesorhizobium prunaredense]